MRSAVLHVSKRELSRLLNTAKLQGQLGQIIGVDSAIIECIF